MELGNWELELTCRLKKIKKENSKPKLIPALALKGTWAELKVEWTGCLCIYKSNESFSTCGLSFSLIHSVCIASDRYQTILFKLSYLKLAVCGYFGVKKEPAQCFQAEANHVITAPYWHFWFFFSKKLLKSVFKQSELDSSVPAQPWFEHEILCIKWH